MKWLKKLFEGDYDPPKGTLAIMVLFALTIILLWSNAYLQMVMRGINQ